MKSLALASLSAFAAPFGVAAAEPAEERAGYRCKVETMRNVSMAKNLPIAEPERVFALDRLEDRGGRLVLEEVVVDPHSESLVTHRIDPATGHYEASAMLSDHAMGEQYQIETTGTCEQVPASAESEQ